MSVGAPSGPPVRRTRGARLSFPWPGAAALAVLGPLDIFGLRAFGESWLTAGIGGGVAAAVGAFFAYTFFGGGSKKELDNYFAPRMTALAIASAIATLIAFLIGAPLVAAGGIGISVGICLGIALMIAMGDL